MKFEIFAWFSIHKIQGYNFLVIKSFIMPSSYPEDSLIIILGMSTFFKPSFS